MSSNQLSKLHLRLKKIQSKIENVNKITEEAIAQLETQKRDLRGSQTSDPTIQKNIQEITVGKDRLIEKLLERETTVKQQIASLELLDFTICQLDREISRIQSERDRTVNELIKKQGEIKKALQSTENLAFEISKLDTQIDSVEAVHMEEMQKLDEEREALLLRTDLTESQKENALAELDRQIAEKRELHEEHMNSLKRQKQESLMLMREYDEDLATEMSANLQAEIDELEAMKVGATESEVNAINERLANLKDELKDIELLGALNARGLHITPSGRIASDDGQIYTVEEAMAKGLLNGLDVMRLILKTKLAAQGLKLTKSGNHLQTRSGKLLTLEEAQELGMLDDSLLDMLKTAMGPRSSLSLSSAAPTHMSSEDVHYLKVSVGKPLTLALAEICTKQPKDPIHYLGHWLFKYRYNQEVDEVKKKEIEELMAEREKIRIEAWNKEVEDAARNAVLEMIFKAHDEAMQKELEKQNVTPAAQEAGGEGEMDELAEEAKDILGEYTGPPAGQRRI